MLSYFRNLIPLSPFIAPSINSTIQPPSSPVPAASTTQPTLSPISNIQGHAYNRFIQIWLENTDFALAAGDPNIAWLSTHGISLTNYWALTHPSQPNYLAAVSGDHFGLDSDDYISVPSNIPIVADLLDTKGIAWGEYQEDMPYAGFKGIEYNNQHTGANAYVRKHNPLVLFESVTQNATRLSLMKSFTSFAADLAAGTLPQWAFVTPNMTNDGHDTSITTAGLWARSFLEPLLNNAYFMNDTLVLLTFDENEHYETPNKVFSLLLGGAVPESLKGLMDNTFYTHYSALSSLEANFDLPSLGRWDCGANIFELVAKKTGYANYAVDTTNLWFSSSYPGPLSPMDAKAWPAPNTNAKCAAGNGVLEKVMSVWGRVDGSLHYADPYPHDDGLGANASVSRLPTPSQMAPSTNLVQSGTASGPSPTATETTGLVQSGTQLSPSQTVPDTTGTAPGGTLPSSAGASVMYTAGAVTMDLGAAWCWDWTLAALGLMAGFL
ncbi:phosphoesterase-domain-containing protein [Mytilinidion resinicola]|uniref:Phosphoesterase-domain-containing protein n=1 Tax=Mytilinidion resinicola TaxID=574789 RepID=A0A6A6Z341_9PEZI|nr:phosphoesterase-domain-containing protein [Mytilinidion resinicola]KAF2815149.1 phosphoesterase-domain-containing protein [Mytilinidion resinicola]